MAGWQIALQPLLPPWALGLLGALALAVAAVMLVRRHPGAGLRIAGMLVLLGALAHPVLKEEESRPLPDVAFLVIDRSTSQTLGRRPARLERAERALAAALARAPGLEVRRVEVGDAPKDGGTRLLSALAEAARAVPPERIAGALLLTDGQVHDAGSLSDFPGPVQVLLTGSRKEIDVRIEIVSAPAFGVVGERVPVRLKVVTGDGPGGYTLPLTYRLGAGAPMTLEVPVQRTLQLRLPLSHAGANLITFSVPAFEGELTPRNNNVTLSVTGVRERLRVLLVSGAPHPGERTWRELLKSDPAVDLVHFTILRPPEKQDGVPIDELALIAFPTQELFIDKIDGFDLIIFDRYELRGLLPRSYLENIARYVREGGALLVSAGPEFAGIGSLGRSPLAEVLPAAPSGTLVERGLRPALSEAGRRHPVTAPLAAAEAAGWGRWFRQLGLDVRRGTVVMTGAEGAPLLVLDRVGRGRVALLASDHIWLWQRGFEGGGPQRELLRRLAHWAMKEPELEEEALVARMRDGRLEVERRTLADSAPPFRLVAPSGAELRLAPEQTGPGRFAAAVEAEETGVWEVVSGTLAIRVPVGPPRPREIRDPTATDALLAPLARATGGGVWWLEDGLPELRRVRAGNAMWGRGWMGLLRREAHDVIGLRLRPLLPAWAWAVLAGALLLGGWLAEGRRRRGPSAGA